MKKLIALATLTVCSAVSASNTSIRVGDDAVAVAFNPQLSPQTSMHLGALYNDDLDTSLFSAGLFANGQRNLLTGRLGGKTYYADLDEESGYGVALGGDFNLALGPNLSLGAGLFLGPSSLSFSDIDNYEEWYLGLNLEIFENASLGAGYWSIEIEPEEGRDAELDDGLFLEMSLRF